MSEPKLHHYVPQFYLRRFVNEAGRLWIWDRDGDRVFAVKPDSVAAEKHFYRLDELGREGHDPLTMEKQFSHLEGEVAQITGQWLDWLRQMEPGEKITVPDVNRELLAHFVALQFLRTADTRDILALHGEAVEKQPLTEERKRDLHTQLLWDEKICGDLAARIREATWIFGRNMTATPFFTSDNPVAFRTRDNAMWVKAGFYAPGTYVVYPLAPDIVMYGHPRESTWEKLGDLDLCLSPVVFTEEMVQSENTAQVFMASRFVISSSDSFDDAREFATTIGTDIYAPYWANRE